MKIYYLFSSITFLQFYIPLVIEGNKRKIRSVFIIRDNYKKYANPLTEENFKILEPYLKEYNIKLKLAKDTDFDNLKGLVFMIDGDIYGPPREKGLNDSLLFKLNPENVTTFSMTEHMNFWAVYHYFIDKVDYCSFSSEHIINQMDQINLGKLDLGNAIVDTNKSYHSEKNIFLGNTKLDGIPSHDEIYDKFNLNKSEKYCLFLFPKIRKEFTDDNIINLYDNIRKLGFKILVKSRPKDPKIDEKLYGDKFICSDIYPNESLELMKISELCVISSSSANEETIFSKIPCIDIVSDLRAWERNQFLLDEKSYVKLKLEEWKHMSFDYFEKVFNKLEKKNSGYFDDLKRKYLFEHSSTSEKIFNFLVNKQII